MAFNRLLKASLPRKSRRKSETTRSNKSTQHTIRSRLTLELKITHRMLADNLLASFTPGLVLVTAVSLRNNLSPTQTLTHLLKATLLSTLYTYIFDAINQAHGAQEGRINKPYRPISSGLTTPTGLVRRFWVAMALYTVSGWALGVLEWTLFWQASTLIINILCPPRHYFWCKTLCMSMGIAAQLSHAWHIVAPIDAVGQRWIMFMAIAYPPPLVFEDVGDMEGDAAAGRRTLALMLGEGMVRGWFAGVMGVMPVMVHVVLFEGEMWRVTLCDALVPTICWTTVARSLTMRNVKADRVTYQLFIFSYIVVLSCGCILWA